MKLCLEAYHGAISSAAAEGVMHRCKGVVVACVLGEEGGVDGRASQVVVVEGTCTCKLEEVGEETCSGRVVDGVVAEGGVEGGVDGRADGRA